MLKGLYSKQLCTYHLVLLLTVALLYHLPVQAAALSIVYTSYFWCISELIADIIFSKIIYTVSKEFDIIF
jgi:hypothetical protein